MAALLIVLGLLASVVAGAVALFTFGTIAGAAVVVLLLALVVCGVVARGGLASAATAVVAVVLVGSLAYGGLTAYQLYAAFTDTEGAADPPDAAALASANAKLDAAEGQAGFRIELTEAELGAVLQDALGDGDSPIRRVDLAVVDGAGEEPGGLDFQVSFKNGSLTGSGRVVASLDAGQINLQVQDVSLGRLTLPGMASGAMEDIIETILSLNERLAEQQADVQSIQIGSGRVLVTGTQGSGELLTDAALLGALAENASAIAGAATAPEEVVGPGTVDGTSAAGSSYVVALGDSLAANVGVTSARQGYVSRVHRVLSERDGTAYGLRNFGVSGETSGTTIRSGQLDAAVEFIEANAVSYVIVDIGANDLLGHLGSADCSASLDAPACQARLSPALAGYEANLERILARLREAAGTEATILFLATYNPFSIGFGGSVGLEATSDAATAQINGIASTVAARHNVTVADGASPMRGTTGATTHILASPPDVHPNASGYDLLAQALIGVLR